jgi:hypothetical protein
MLRGESAFGIQVISRVTTGNRRQGGTHIFLATQSQFG